MQSKATDPKSYVAEAPEERRPHLERLRALVKRSVPRAKETMQWGMIAWTIDERPFAALASQKQSISLYLMDLYTQPGLREKHAKALASLDMGKSCIHFRRADDLPLDAIADILKAAPGFVVTKGTLAAKTTAPAKKSAKKSAEKSAKRAGTAGRRSR